MNVKIYFTILFTLLTPESGGPANTVGIPTVESCTVQLLQSAGLDQWRHSEKEIKKKMSPYNCGKHSR
jgi:hypothetical protein